MMLLSLVLIFGALVICILWRPYLGVVVTISSVAAVDLVTDFPMATSAISALGGVTLIAFCLKSIRTGTVEVTGWTKGHLLSLLFVVWIVASNPEASMGAGVRVWLWTFVQLWVIAWLTGRLLQKPKEHLVLMWLYSAVAITSAAYAIQQGSIGEGSNDMIRGEGLAGGANSAARYILVALIFLNCVRGTVKNFVLYVLVSGAIAISAVGVIFTGSRTGMLLLAGVLAMIVFDRTGGRRRQSLGLLIVVGLVFLFLAPDRVLNIFQSVGPSITRGTDTVGLRYSLWEAGLAMWRDNPLAGVGIGQFPYRLKDYDIRRFLGAHNMYIQVLAETGLIGATLFMGMLGTSFVALWRATRCANKRLSALAKAWLTAFIVLLVGGLTKHDQADKLLWICIGVSFYFELQSRHLAERAKCRISGRRKVLLTSRPIKPGSVLISARRIGRKAQHPKSTLITGDNLSFSMRMNTNEYDR